MLNKNIGQIRRAVKILNNNGTVVFPTETLYGLAALSTNKKAVKKVYSIKQRPQEKLLPVIVGSMEQAKKYFIFNSNDLKLAQAFWPGPLSLVLKTRSKKIAAALGSNILAVRYPDNSIAASLAELSGAPITSTSANSSGQPGCFTIAVVKEQFAGINGGKSTQPDFYLNGGPLKRSLPSTIVRTKKNAIEVIRAGKTPLEKIAGVLFL
jgi:L-threonylcarbamoyladenylate synthase